MSSTKASPGSDNWYANVEKTSRTDDERIKDITVLPPPEHLIRFFPIRGTPVETLIANTHSVAEIRELVGADSLGYLSLDGLVRAVGLPEDDLCNACFHGRYPMAIEGVREKFAYEVA